MAFSWLTLEDQLSAAALTVRVQELPPTDRGDLIWDIFFPPRDVDSHVVEDISTLDWRPAAEQREWDARGRHIPLKTPARRKAKIIPVESFFKVEEEELTRLMERADGNRAVFRRLVGANIPERTDMLADANYRRIELMAIEAWTSGTVTQRNPENAAQTYVTSFGIPAARINTAAVAWNDAGQNAYTLATAWVSAARDMVGPVRGMMLKQHHLDAILADAPNQIGGATMTRQNLQERFTQDLGQPFEFVVNENTVDVFTDGGTATTRTDVWPSNKVAAIPVGNQVGVTAFAPVNRAYELSRIAGGRRINLRRNTVYHEIGNGGRELTVECQIDPLPFPNESKIYVTNVGF